MEASNVGAEGYENVNHVGLSLNMSSSVEGDWCRWGTGVVNLAIIKLTPPEQLRKDNYVICYSMVSLVSRVQSFMLARLEPSGEKQ